MVHIRTKKSSFDEDNASSHGSINADVGNLGTEIAFLVTNKLLPPYTIPVSS